MDHDLAAAAGVFLLDVWKCIKNLILKLDCITEVQLCLTELTAHNYEEAPTAPKKIVVNVEMPFAFIYAQLVVS